MKSKIKSFLALMLVILLAFSGCSKSDTQNINNTSDIVSSSSSEEEMSSLDLDIQLNNTTISTSGQTTIAVKKDGTVVAVGKNTYGECNVSDWTDIIAVSGNLAHTVGLKITELLLL